MNLLSKKIHVLIVALFIITCSGCNYSKGFKKDGNTGLEYSYNGFRLESVDLYDNYRQAIKNKEVPLGTTIYMQMTDLSGFVIEDELVSPICQLVVTDSKGYIVLENENLYKGNKEIKSKDLKSLQFSVRMLDPIIEGETYTIKVFLMDEKNKDSKLDIEYTVKVTPNLNKFKQFNTGLEVKNIYLLDENGILPQDKAFLNSKISVFLAGVKNFTIEKGKVYPGCEIIISDKDGTEMLYAEDLFAQYTDGVNEEAASSIKASATLAAPMKAKEVYKMTVRVFDKKNTKNTIQVENHIEIIE